MYSPELEQEAREKCGDDNACLYDVAQTGNLEVGANTKAEGEEEGEVSSKLGELAPGHWHEQLAYTFV